MAFPVRIERYEINPDSGGAGSYRGGCGARRVWRMLEGADATGALCMERMTSPPFGLLGGKAGAPAVVTLTTPDGATRHLPSKGAFSAPAGSVIDMITPGSGGFGPVGERDPAAIGRDLLDGYVSDKAAQQDYGITDPQALRAKRREGPGMTYIPNSIEARDIASLVHMQTNLRKHQTEGPLVITRGEGCRVFDNSGRDYIEAVAGPVVRVAGLRLRAAGQGRLRADARARLLPPLSPPLQRARHRARREAARDRAGADGARRLPVLGLGGQRHRHQARLVLLARQVGEPQRTKIIARQYGLPRQHLRRRQPVRQARHARGLRPAVRQLQAHRVPALLPPPRAGRERGAVLRPHGRGAGDADRGGRARHHRGLLRRAGDGRGRRHHAA